MNEPIKANDHNALNEAFALKVAGWTQDADGLWLEGEYQIDMDGHLLFPRFTRSVDTVLPYLEKQIWFYAETEGARFWRVHVATGTTDEKHYKARSESFSLAIVIALLRAHGVEVIDDE